MKVYFKNFHILYFTNKFTLYSFDGTTTGSLFCKAQLNLFQQIGAARFGALKGLFKPPFFNFGRVAAQ